MKIAFDIQNSFWIKKLEKEITFSWMHSWTQNFSNIVIYAPNGTMKTSLAKIFHKIQTKKEKDIRDELFDLPSSCSITIDNEKIKPDEVFVIPSFESYYQSKGMSNLLIDEKLKKDLKDIWYLRGIIYKKLQEKSGLKITKAWNSELDNQISSDFWWKSFLQNILAIHSEMSKYEIFYPHVKYVDIFDSVVFKKICSKSFQEKISDYLHKTDDIYRSYSFLKKWEFSLGKLKSTFDGLKKNNFFVNENGLFLTNFHNKITEQELWDKILKIEWELKESKEFMDIEGMLQDTKWLILKDVLDKNPEIITDLQEKNLQNLRKKLWYWYLWDIPEFCELLKVYKLFQDSLKAIDFNLTP